VPRTAVQRKRDQVCRNINRFEPVIPAVSKNRQSVAARIALRVFDREAHGIRVILTIAYRPRDIDLLVTATHSKDIHGTGVIAVRVDLPAVQDNRVLVLVVSAGRGIDLRGCLFLVAPAYRQGYGRRICLPSD